MSASAIPGPARPAAAAVAAGLLAAGAFGGVEAQPAGAGLEEIVVTSSRVATPLREVGADVSVLDGADIRLRGYASLADVLRTQPGIAVSGSGGLGKNTTLRIRGEEGYRTLVMIDGVELADPTTPQAGASFDHLLATSDLARVEVLRGPQGFIYGADAGGVVNVLTRRGEGPPSGELGGELGSFGTAKLEGELAGGGKRGDYFLSATGIGSDGFNSRVDDTVLRDADGYRNRTFHAKLGLDPTDRLRLQLVAHDVDARSRFDGCGFPTSYDCLGTSRQKTYRGSASFDAGRFSNLFAYSAMDVATRSFTAGIADFASDGGIARAEYTGSFEPTPAATFVYGLDLKRETIRGEADGGRRNRNAYYFEYQGRVGDRFFFSAGTRHDYSADFGGHTSSRVTGAYVRDLGRGAALKYRASFGTGFRAPSLFELAYDRGPAAFGAAAGLDLAPESSSGYDLGVDFSSASGLSADLTYFDQRIDDEIYFDAAGFSGYLQAVGRSRSHGAELALGVPIAGRWSFVGNYTYDRTEDRAGRERVRRPEQIGNLGVRYGASGARLRVIADYRFSRGAVDEVYGLGRVPLDDYGVLDVSASLSVSRVLVLYARAENLTDARYEEVVGFNTGGRALAAGLRLTF